MRTDASIGIEALSPRRRELLQLLARGLTNDELATALGITSGTVRSHVATVLAQLDVANRTEAAAAYAAWAAQPSRVEAVLRRPALAVLPLMALGDDDDVSIVAAGITEDLASLFSRCCWFPVIATVASGTPRAPGTTNQETATRLGARFLVDGSLRRGRSGYRLSVHLDDAESGDRMWSVQEELPATRLFDAQDSIGHAVVAAAYPLLIARVLAAFPQVRSVAVLTAWQLAHKGMALRAVRQPDANASAIGTFREALAREPDLVLAHFGLGLSSYDAILNQWGSREAALDGLGLAAARCIEHAPHCAEGYFLAGRYEQARGEWDRMRAPLEAAIGRNPSFALAHGCLSQSLQVAGRSDEALVRMKHAARLGPGAFVTGLATLHFMRGEYGDAVTAAEQAVGRNPEYSFARALAAAGAFWRGDVPRARAHWRALRVGYPPFDTTRFLSTFGDNVHGVDRFVHALDALAAKD